MHLFHCVLSKSNENGRTPQSTEISIHTVSGSQLKNPFSTNSCSCLASNKVIPLVFTPVLIDWHSGIACSGDGSLVRCRFAGLPSGSDLIKKLANGGRVPHILAYSVRAHSICFRFSLQSFNSEGPLSWQPFSLLPRVTFAKRTNRALSHKNCSGL